MFSLSSVSFQLENVVRRVNVQVVSAFMVFRLSDVIYDGGRWCLTLISRNALADIF